jgi:hypothetical protein
MWMITLPFFPAPSGPHLRLFSAEKCEIHRDKLMHFPNLGFQYNVESGIFGFFLSYIDDPSTFWLFNCNALAGILEVSIVMCALGLGWKIPRILTAITYWIMLLIKQSMWSSGNSHSSLLGAFAFVVLCFAENNLIDKWSIDSCLVSIYRKVWPVAEHKSSSGQRREQYVIHGAAAGGASRKFVMCVTTVAFFFAGLHKVAEVPWLGWLDGRTLERAVRTQTGHWQWLHSFFLEHPFLFKPLAVITIVGEVGVVAIDLSKWWRPFGIATLYMFHIGVYLLMNPNFITHGVSVLDYERLMLHSVSIVDFRIVHVEPFIDLLPVDH